MSAMTGAGGKYGLSDHLFAIIGLGALWGSLWSHISPSHVTFFLPFSITRSCCFLSSTAQGARAPGQALLKSQFNLVTVVPPQSHPMRTSP